MGADDQRYGITVRALKEKNSSIAGDGAHNRAVELHVHVESSVSVDLYSIDLEFCGGTIPHGDGVLHRATHVLTTSGLLFFLSCLLRWSLVVLQFSFSAVAHTLGRRFAE